ncbi:TraR/DksA C4-type zinc finger protein [bacterium]|nr:TraR/DksA C4-type zinc finger protein [bacterium]MCI0607115.1 TraR/DksA C4-type zinc finger protein [bacterium]
MDKKQLEKYRKKLVEKRKDILDEFRKNVNYRMESAADDGTQDIADKATMAYNKEFLFSLTDSERDMLQLIDEALIRINTKDFGVCNSCQSEIKVTRLEAVPWARYCLNCQELQEQGLLE